jgi:sensor histidine kinase regulating citrate/malate metabolism
MKRSERSRIDDLILLLKLLEEQEQANPKASRRREIIKIRAEINEIETNKQTENIQRINETKIWFNKKINNIDRPLVNLIKKRTDKSQINKIRNAKGEITTNTMEIQEINREYIERIYTINLKILKKWTDL